MITVNAASEEPGIPASGFIGRRQEMSDLRAALEAAISGQGRLVMVVGEPGIGKTRTAQELAVQAEAYGVRVLWGRCYEEAGTPPYWPWLQSLRSYVEQRTAEQLQAEMGPGAGDIAEIVSEVRDKLPIVGTPPILEPDQARFRLFSSIATFLKSSTQARPLLLVLDDLHWADRSSLLLLEFVIREIQTSPLLVLGTYRDVEVSRRHPLSETLGGLIREQGFTRVQLPRLARQEVAEMIQRNTGFVPPPDLVEAIHRRTDGNPLFVSEVIRTMEQRDQWGSQKSIAGIPEGIRDAIGRRLNRISEACNQLLTTASVIGRDFDFKVLRASTVDLKEDKLLRLLDEALDAHLIEETSGGLERFQFSHGLVQQTLASDLSVARRVRLHSRIGGALERLYGDDSGRHASEIAYHFAEAQAVVGTEKMVRYSLLAGEQALATYAYEDAIAHFERGLAARGISLSGTGAVTDEEAADLLFGLARARSATVLPHQLAEAFAALSRAFEYYAQSGNVSQAVGAAEFQMGNPTGRIRGRGQLVVRALTLVPDESHESARLLSHYGGILGLAESDYEGAQQALGRAIAIARREGDVPLEVQTLAYAADVSGQHLHWQESVDHGLRGLMLATEDITPSSEVMLRFWTAISLLHLGERDAARPHALALRDVAEKRSTPRQLFPLGLVPIITMSCLEGDWRAGREHCDRGLEMAPSHPQLLALRVLMEHETGESAQGEAYLNRLLEGVSRTGAFGFTVGRASMVTAAVGRITGVPGRLERIALSESELSVTPVAVMYVKAGSALLAIQKGELSAAKEHYAYLLGHRGTMIWTFSSADRLLGLLSQTMGDLDQAITHFQDALAFCRKAGYRPDLAWTCHDYAEAILLQEGSGDLVMAGNLLQEALSIALELSMNPLRKLLISLQQRLGRSARPSGYPGGLTEREVEVVRLIAQGKANRDIAQELVLSQRTVQRHIANLYRKIQVRNRAEATAFVLKRLNS